MKAKNISDVGVRNIIYEVIISGTNEWKKAAVYLRKETGVDPLKVDHAFENRYRCNKKVMSRIKDLKDAEVFFRGETYEFYSKTLDCYIEPERLLNELNKRTLDEVLKQPKR